MSSNNESRLVRGLFLRPQHFQQHDQYPERFIVDTGWEFQYARKAPASLTRAMLPTARFATARAM